MSPYQILGLEDDASPQDIKRAYARLLRKHRPDEDPQGFQRVHEAYSYCLHLASLEQADDDEWGTGLSQSTAEAAFIETPPVSIDADSVETDLIHSGSIHAASSALQPPTPAFQVDAFVDELHQVARDGTIDMDTWLQRHEGLYNIENKTMVADALVWHLHQRPPLPPRRLKTVLRHFELDMVNPRYPQLGDSVEVLQRNSAEAHGDPDWSFVLQQELQPAPRQREGSPWPWFVGIFFLIKIFAALVHS